MTKPVLPDPALEVVTVIFGFGGFFEVNQAAVPGRDLYAFVAKVGHVFTNAVEAVEGGFIAHELS